MGHFFKFLSLSIGTKIFSMTTLKHKQFQERRFFFFLLFSAFSFISMTAHGQLSDYEFGARSKGLGHTNTTMADAWSIFNNVAGISGPEAGVVFFGYDRYFDIEGFDKVAAGIIQPFGFGSIGISTLRFGDDLYNEQIVSGAFGNKIGFVRLGFRASYYQMRISDFGSASTVFFDIGGIVEMIPSLSFAAYISNFTASTLNDVNKTRLPVSMKLGLSYTPTEDIMLNFDLYKDVEFNPVLRAGLEYKIVDKLFVRTGFNSAPFKVFFGGGVSYGRFIVDYAITSSTFLGMSHQASVSFNYQK